MENIRPLLEFRARRNRLTIPRCRILRDRYNPFEAYGDEDFRRRFCFTKESVLNLVEMLKSVLMKDSRGFALPVHLQVLIALRFYSGGAFHIVTGDVMGVHEATVCRLVKRVSEAVCLMRKDFIYFPPSQELPHVCRRFAELSKDNLPGILGAIDCTHIRIQLPSKREAKKFFCRKLFHSVNCQVICDADMKIRNIVARWPGSTHDSRIFRNSKIKAVLERGAFEGHLLGDSGYACKKYLLTPVLCERTNADRKYNKAHRRARNVIERVFGIWKKRFPCLHYTLRTKLTTTHIIIVATAVLHNFSLQRNEENFEEDIQESRVEAMPDERDEISGLRWRQQIIVNHFQ